MTVLKDFNNPMVVSISNKKLSDKKQRKSVLTLQNKKSSITRFSMYMTPEQINQIKK